MSKPLKSQVENGVGQLIRNHLRGLGLAPIGAAADTPTPFPARARRPAATPRGGAHRAQGLSLAQRPASFSGPCEVRK